MIEDEIEVLPFWAVIEGNVVRALNHCEMPQDPPPIDSVAYREISESQYQQGIELLSLHRIIDDGGNILLDDLEDIRAQKLAEAQAFKNETADLFSVEAQGIKPFSGVMPLQRQVELSYLANAVLDNRDTNPEDPCTDATKGAVFVAEFGNRVDAKRLIRWLTSIGCQTEATNAVYRQHIDKISNFDQVGDLQNYDCTSGYNTLVINN